MLYSGDKPNPHLRRFVEAHIKVRPFHLQEDKYDVPEFDRPINTNKHSPIYGMHPYHLGKKPFDAIQAYISHYTSEGDLVLDPFCGSGSTALAALMLSRKSVAIDASPAATFITRFCISDRDPEDLRQRFEKLCLDVKPETDDLYGTRCHLCGGPAVIHHVIYSNVYQCPVCLKPVTLFEASLRKPSCCPTCFSRKGLIQPITPFLRASGYEPVAVSLSCKRQCGPKRLTRAITGSAAEIEAFERIDLPRIREIESSAMKHRYPDRFMMDVKEPAVPWGDEWRPSRNFRQISDLFTPRNLKAVAALMSAAGSDNDMRAIITSGMLAMSRKAQHLNGGGGYIPGNWALPPMSKQRNVIETLRKVFSRTYKAKQLLHPMLRSTDVCVSTQSATSLSEIPSSSVDYIFTDPPYGSAVQYAELNFLWEAWLGFSTAWHDCEVVVNNTRGKGPDDWAEMMRSAMGECRRVLKPGRWLSLCYHDTSVAMWGQIQRLMADAGFEIGECRVPLYIDTGSATYNQRVTQKAVKRDLVINFRKSPKPRFAMKPVWSESDFRERVRSCIHEYLRANPGAPKDRIYDHLISALMRDAHIQAINFERVLREVARKNKNAENSWFLKDPSS
ncbi:MAG: hypothetical protein HY912_10610 [Desulfomonile tiedjei]|uniref:site-specific DNA-methyltransferase (adenine-specific) n=1 Tax=Desulfomonile tiedjei TaxID=2358 RepID=A0A9D6V386_9BACT|nr:hypothetical protein [Desulfomonile tiedjei]